MIGRAPAKCRTVRMKFSGVCKLLKISTMKISGSCADHGRVDCAGWGTCVRHISVCAKCIAMCFRTAASGVYSAIIGFGTGFGTDSGVCHEISGGSDALADISIALLWARMTVFLQSGGYRLTVWRIHGVANETLAKLDIAGVFCLGSGPLKSTFVASDWQDYRRKMIAARSLS